MNITELSKLEAMDERIDRYLQNKMSTDEESQFMDDIQKDEALRERAATIAILAKNIRRVKAKEAQELFEEIKNDEEYTHVEAANTSKRILVPLWQKTIGIGLAAGMCLFLGNKYLLQSSVDNIIEDSGIDVTQARGGDFDINLLTSLASKINNGGDIPACITKLQPLFDEAYENEAQETSILGWYLAVAYVRDGQKGEAIAVLQKVLEQNPEFNEASQLRDQLSKTFFWQ